MTIKHKWNRILPCILAGLLTAPLFTACKKSEERGQTDSEKKVQADFEETQAESEKPKAPIPGEKDYEKGDYYMEQGDQETAIKFFAKAAESGNPGAMNRLGTIYHQEKKYEEAFAYFKQASELGDLDAMNNLATYYYEGIGCEASIEEAFKLFLKLAESGNAYAQTNVGSLYFIGKGVAQSYEEAVKWYRKAVEQGYPQAIVNLGKAYLWGQGVPENPKTAFDLFKQAAEKESEEGYYRLGVCYLEGLGVERNEPEAGACFGHAYNLIRKMEDTPSHQYELALACYSFYLDSATELRQLKAKREARASGGWDSKQHDDLLDMDKQIEELQRNSMAPHHHEEFHTWLKKAAENGNPRAQYRMAEESRFSEEKINWYKKAAEQGLVEANRELGKLYYDPWERNSKNSDPAEAKQWYEKAAEQGDAPSQYALARIYMEIEKDDAKAVTWYKKTAEHPFVEDSYSNEEVNSAIVAAQYYLAKCYANGKGVEDDENEAFKWYKKAAGYSGKLVTEVKLGEYRSAQYELGVCYEHGWGCSKNEEEAIKWYKASEDSYNETKLKAQTALKRLGK